MPVVDDIRALAEQAHRELTGVHDFFEHSKFVWQSFQMLVDEGHKIVATNLATGTRIDQDGLVQLAPQYTREYLAAFTLRQFVSTFEAFFFNFLQRVLAHNPWQFSKSTLEFEVVLKAKDREDAIAWMLLKKLNELRYEKPKDWFDSLNKALKLDCPSDDEIDALAEVKVTRDIFEHNAGVVNDIYLRKAGKKARYKVGEQIEIDDTYHLESWKLLKKLVADLSTAATAKLAPASVAVP